jgi:adenine-specific DNA-methyltransferase
LEVEQIVGKGAFSFPKDVKVIQDLVRLVTGPQDIVLDFFAGSGTTGHAVHELNAEDRGRRRCILVSNSEASEDDPQKNLCRDVCAKRVRSAIEGYTPPNGEPVPGLGGDFAYLRCRRIAPGRLMEIDHAQVWTALQLIHCETLGEYREAAILRAGDEDQLLIYVPRFRRGDAGALRKAVKESRAVIVYSWQPELIRQQLRDETHVQVEAVPESLARRFGMKV